MNEFLVAAILCRDMGSFFTNCQVRGSSPEAVSQTLAKLIKQRAYVSPEKNGWITVYPEDAENHNEQTLGNIAAGLSKALKTDVIAFLVHDSDIAAYWIYRCGTLLDTFDSCPSYFKEVDQETLERLRGKTDVLASLCPPGTTTNQIEGILHPTEEEGFPAFAEEIVRDIGKLLGIDEDRAALGFNYFEEEGEEILPDANEFLPVGKGAERKTASGRTDSIQQNKMPMPDHFVLAVSMMTQPWDPQFSANFEKFASLLKKEQNEIAAQVLKQGDRMARDFLKHSSVAVTFDQLKSARDEGPEALAAFVASHAPDQLTDVGFQAVVKALVEFAVALLKHGLDPNGSTTTGHTILSAAERHETNSKIYQLVKAAADAKKK